MNKQNCYQLDVLCKNGYKEGQSAGEQHCTFVTVLTMANDLYTNGYANYLEIITAQQSLLEADLALVKIK